MYVVNLPPSNVKEIDDGHTTVLAQCAAGFSVLTIRRSCNRWSAAANSAACTRFPLTAPTGYGPQPTRNCSSGHPMKLVAPEMAVAAPPPAQQPAIDPSIPLAEEARGTGAGVSAKPVVAATTRRGWYYENQGAQHGPVEEPTLRQMLVIGQLDADALVWNDSMPQWVAASQVPGLIPEPAMNRGGRGGGDSLAWVGRRPWRVFARRPRASRPWVLFLAITAFVYAGLCYSRRLPHARAWGRQRVPALGRDGAVLDRQRRGDCRGRNPSVELRQPSCQPDLRSFVQGPGKRHGPAENVLDVREHCPDRDPGVYWVSLRSGSLPSASALHITCDEKIGDSHEYFQ